MSSPTPEGNAQVPQSFDSSRISPAIREALREHSPEVRKAVLNTADAPATPNAGLVR